MIDALGVGERELQRGAAGRLDEAVHGQLPARAPGARGSRRGSSPARGSTHPIAASARRTRDGGALRASSQAPASNSRQSVSAGEVLGLVREGGTWRASRVCLRGAMAVILVPFRPRRECLRVGGNFCGHFSSHRTCSVWEAHDRHEPQAQVSPVRRRARENATRALAAVGSRLQPARRGRPDGELAARALGRRGPLAARRHRRRHPARALDALRRRPRLSHPAAACRAGRNSTRSCAASGRRRPSRSGGPAGDLSRTRSRRGSSRSTAGRAPASTSSCGCSAPTGSARSPTTGPGSGSSSRATSSTAPARSRPAVRWPSSTTSTSALPGRAAMS